MKSDISIMNEFPGTPRPQQENALRQIESNWDQADVFVIEIPTGGGKSRIAVTLARWVNKKYRLKSNILAPTNILVDQYREEFPKMHTLARKGNYRCFGKEGTRSYSSCQDHYDGCGNHCRGCPYIATVRKSHIAPYGIYNPYTYLAHRLYKPVLIVDEAHNLVKMITSMAAKRIWKKQYNFPNWVTNYRTLFRWVQDALKEFPNDRKLNILNTDLETGKMRYLVERAIETNRGKEEEVLNLLPIDISEEKPVLWPSTNKNPVRKIILLSATFSKVDLQQLGLDKKRVMWIKTDSPIPTERRPISYQGVEHYSSNSLPSDKTWKWLESAMESHPHVKGLIHMPYSMARVFESKLPDTLRQRLMFHDNLSKQQVYEEWRTSDPVQGKVLVASGMYEGIDLKGPEFGWQAILKIPFPNLGEPALRYLADEKPEQYAWLAIKDVLQASGRICRAPDDYGDCLLYTSPSPRDS